MLQTAPFLAYGATQIATATGTTLTATFTTSTLGYPSVRVTNAGTAGATIFVNFIGTGNTVTVGVTNAQPILAGQSVLELSTRIVSQVSGRHRIALKARGRTAVWIDGKVRKSTGAKTGKAGAIVPISILLP